LDIPTKLISALAELTKKADLNATRLTQGVKVPCVLFSPKQDILR